MLRKIQNVFAGHVSKTMLLTVFLPLSIAIFFGTLVIAAFFPPVPYDWRVRTISSLTSPRDNPDAYWLPSIGIAAAALLLLPFAGYVEQHMRSVTPRVARVARVAFALAFILFLLAALIAQPVHPWFGWKHVHEIIARIAAVAFFLGMLCCSASALMDRFRIFGGQRSLGTGLSYYWVWGTLLPVGCAAIMGTLQFLGHEANQAWAEQARESFRHTMMWRLAFWEWVGAVALFTFVTVTVLLLPERIRSSA